MTTGENHLDGNELGKNHQRSTNNYTTHWKWKSSTEANHEKWKNERTLFTQKVSFS